MSRKNKRADLFSVLFTKKRVRRMASPQRENGYTAIANELLEQIYLCSFNGTQLRIILFMLRYTYGFNRKSCEMSLSFLHSSVGGDKRTLRRELQKLINGNVIQIISEATFSSSRELAVNKNYEGWGEQFALHIANKPTEGELPSTTEGELPHHIKQTIKQTIKQNNMSEASSDESADNKIKNVEIIDIDSYFEDTYAEYPKKEGKKDGKQAYIQYLTKGREFKGFPNIRLNHAEIRVAIQEYVKSKYGTDTQFFPMFSTFMNGGIIDYIDENNEHFRKRYERVMERTYGENWQKIKFKYKGRGIDK